MKRKYYLVLDTETASLTGEVYDLGWTICDRRGNVYRERQYLVREVLHNPILMMGAYFARKVFSWYLPRIESGEVRSKPWLDIVAKLQSDMIEFKVEGLCAYNLRFDMNAIRQTNNKYGNGEKVLPFKVNLLCLWFACCLLRLNSRNYKQTAKKFDWVSEAGNFRTTAEHAYRYCKHWWDFTESHTALDDAKIETELLAWCFARRKGLPWNENPGQPWRIVNS